MRLRFVVLILAIAAAPATVGAGVATSGSKWPTRSVERALAQSDALDALGQAGKYDEQHAAALKAMKAAERRYGAGSYEVAIFSSVMATALDDLGRFEEAWPLHERAVTTATRIQPTAIETYQMRRAQLLSWCNGGRGMDAVEPSAALAREVEARFGPSHRETVFALLQQAYAYDMVGRYSEALPVHERTLALAKQVIGPKTREVYEEMNNFGMNYYYLGRIDEALSMFTQATDGLEVLLGPEHPWVVAGRNNLAVALQSAGRLPEAIAIMEKAYEVDARTLGERHPDTLLRLGNLGQLAAEVGDPARSATLLEKAIAGYEPNQRRDSPNAIVARYNLAGAYADLGRIDEARAGYHAALADQIRVAGPRENYTLHMYSIIARFERDHGQPAAALKLWDALVEATETLRAEGDLAPESRQAFFARWVQGYKDAAALRAATGDLDGALRLTELSKARTLLESGAVRAANELAIPDAESRAKVAALEAAVREVDAAIAAEPDAEKRLVLDGEKGAAVRAYGAFRRELAERYPKYAALSDVKIVDRKGGAALLGRDTAFVNLLLLDREHAMALVLDRAGVLKARLLDLKPGFLDTVAAYRRLLSAPNGWTDLLADGLRVYQRADGSFVLAEKAPGPDARLVKDAGAMAARIGALLLEPLAPEIGRATQVVIAPDGALATLPFEALPYKGRPLVADHEVSYAQSLSMFALLKARSAAAGARGPGRLLAMGGAEYGPLGAAPAGESASADSVAPADGAAAPVRGATRRSALEAELADDPRRALDALRGTWEPLPGTAREVARVGALFGARATLRTGAQASEATLAALDASGELARFRYLLFSTHGYLSVRVPALSSVVLSQRTPEPGTDGYVTAVEWPGYRLDSDLLVLSACETGLGGTVQGEGVMGLPYALYVAGNRDTVLSLWSVVDQSTEEFMARFFARIARGDPPAQALARTKREFLKHPSWSAPLYWAPFVLYGGG